MSIRVGLLLPLLIILSLYDLSRFKFLSNSFSCVFQHIHYVWIVFPFPDILAASIAAPAGIRVSCLHGFMKSHNCPASFWDPFTGFTPMYCTDFPAGGMMTSLPAVLWLQTGVEVLTDIRRGGWRHLPFQLRFKSWPINLSSLMCMIW